MKGKLNVIPNVGDRVRCLHMDGETSVPPGTEGTVLKVGRDPFEGEESYLIEVRWDNGSSLALVSAVDAWKILTKEKVQEQFDDSWKFMTENEDIFENFDWRWLRSFLYKIRSSGIINMFSAAPLLYAGKNHIERYYGEGREDSEEFQDMIDDADESKDKIIQGVIKYMTNNNKDLDNLDMVNRYARHFSQKILGLYITMSNLKH